MGNFLQAFSCYLAPAPANERYSFDMPGQRRTVGGRARGSTLARLAGIGLIVVLAAGGVAAYLVTFHPLGAGSGPTLPTRVVSYQTVGMVAQNAQPGSSGQLMQLLGGRDGVQFSPVSQAEQQSGTGRWTADLMAGGSYIFIFVGSDNCLGVTGTGGQARLVVQHCDLQANQRWRRLGASTVAQGHNFYPYANMADRSCITEGTELPGPVWAAGLSACTRASTDQLLAFWWSAGSAG
jgi:hypothetical protein